MQEAGDTTAEALSRGDPAAASLPDKERALLDLVELLTRHAYRTTQEHVQRVRDAGWTDEQIAECVYITSLFALFNRVADAFGLADPGQRQLLASGGTPPTPANKPSPP
ncbi:MAG: carboxymuconolactone decarboxylase family protein [Planctomycetota bacterium]|nr:carboxymuconolactone decarboxylase family protein [Planctomycetota bacterium]